MKGGQEPKSVRWVGSSKKDVRSFPESVRRDIGHALYAAQCGATDPTAKAFRGFGGRSVLGMVTSEARGTWRTVYTVRFADAVYVLHAFQKKSKKGIATPKMEREVIRQRLGEARQDNRERQT